MQVLPVLPSVIQSTRPPFLLLAIVCSGLGIALAQANAQTTGDILWSQASLIMLAAIAAHISVNCFNEYSDFNSGLDQITQKTPFSGGSGSLITNPNAAIYVLWVAIFMLAVVIAIGLFFALHAGWRIVPVGILGILCILFYTKWINRSPLLCLITPGMCFGPIMVAGSYFALTQTLPSEVIWVSLVPFCLTNNLLLLNQVPDIAADKTVGRNHLSIRYGIKAAAKVYTLFCLAAISVLAICLVNDWLPVVSALAFLPMAITLYPIIQIHRFEGHTETLIKAMATNVAVTLLTPSIITMSVLLIAV